MWISHIVACNLEQVYLFHIDRSFVALEKFFTQALESSQDFLIPAAWN